MNFSPFLLQCYLIAHRLFEPSHRLGAHHVRFAFLDVVRIVQHDAVTALACTDAADGRCEFPARAGVADLGPGLIF